MSTIVLVVLVVVFFTSTLVSSSLKKTFETKEEKIRKQYESEIEDAGDWERNRIEERYKMRQQILKQDNSRVVETVKIVHILVLGLMGLNTLFATMYTVNEQETAILNTLGKAETVEGTGLHFKIPYIQQVTKISSAMRGMAVGYEENDNETISSDSLMITKDFNLVNVDCYVEYRVSDAVQYLYGSSNPEEILENISKASMRNTIGQYDVDHVLTTGKSEIQSAIKDSIIAELQTTKTGLSVSNVTIQDSEPPTEEVANAFKAVEKAKQDAETAINNAERYRNEQLPQATAEVDSILKNAEATKQERIDEANGEVAIFEKMYSQYLKDVEASKLRIYYETLEELLPNLKVIVNGTDAELKPVIVNEKTEQKEN